MSAPAWVPMTGPHAAALGTTHTATIEWQDAEGGLVPIADLTPELSVYRFPGGPAVLTCNAGNSRLTKVDGKLRWVVAAADLATLGAGDYVYGLTMTGASGVIGLIAGPWLIVRQGEGAQYAPPGPVIVRGETAVIVVSHGVLPIGAGVTAHADLSGRSAADAHPISSITNLQAQLSAIIAELDTCATVADLATVAGNLASTTAALAAHAAGTGVHTLSGLSQSGATSGQVPSWNGSAWVPATPAGLPAGGVLERGLRKLSGTAGDADWSGRAIRHGAPAGDGDWSAATLDLRDNPVANSGGGQQALRVLYKIGTIEYSVVMGGAQSGVGLYPLAVKVPVPVAGESANQYRVDGLVWQMGAVGLVQDCIIYPASNIWASTYPCLILGWGLVNAPSAVGGSNYYVERAGTPPTLGNATAGYVVRTFRKSTRSMIIHWDDGAQTEITGTTTGP